MGKSQVIIDGVAQLRIRINKLEATKAELEQGYEGLRAENAALKEKLDVRNEAFDHLAITLARTREALRDCCTHNSEEVRGQGMELLAEIEEEK